MSGNYFSGQISSAFDSYKKGVESAIKDTFGPKKPPTIPEDQNRKITSALLNGVYAINPSDWYVAKPYGFTFTNRSSNKLTMFLPISPSNLTITTNFATNIIPTLYGTVEEHSEIRYYDIVIEGTTGFAPKFIDPQGGEPSDAYKAAIKYGRISPSVSKGLTAITGGFFAKTLNTLSQAVNKAKDYVNPPEQYTGFADENSGYVAFHNLYRFLKIYKDDVSGRTGDSSGRKEHPLTFFNYKDGNSYDVAVRGFTLRRSAENPMLYYYNITLRGYNLRSVTDNGKMSEIISEREKKLGLNGVEGSELFSKFQKLAKTGKSLLKGISSFGDIAGR